MAENEPLTPEKQLLKLIENPKQASVRAASVKREGRKWFSLGAFKGRLDFWKSFSVRKPAVQKRTGKEANRIRRLNAVLWVLLIFMAGYTAYSLWDMTTGIRKASNLILNPDRSVAEPKEPEIRLQDVAFYLEKIRSRNIFNAAPPEAKPERKKEDGEPVTDEKPLQAQDDEATKNFSLVGIAWSDDPEAMIEDKAASRTLFVRRGQSLPNGVRVVTIFKEKIILSYKGKEFELS